MRNLVGRNLLLSISVPHQKNHRNAIAGLRKTVYRNGSPILSQLANNTDVTRRASDRPTD